MGTIIQFTPQQAENTPINVSALKTNSRKLKAGLIAPATEEVENVLAPDHAAEPIKRMEDIDSICSFLLENERYRDYMLFVTGINFGLRVSDLRCLRFCDLIDHDFTFKNRFPVFERKTRKTRKVKKNRYISINDAVIEAVTLYLEHTPDVKLSDYMFRSESNRGGNKNEPISSYSVERILKGISSDLGLGIHMSTHSLRKTWALHQMVMSNHDPRKLMLLQKMLNHSSMMQTLTYIGITDDEIDKAYKDLNLGSKHNYLAMSEITEEDIHTA